ncbi:Hydrogenase accessory protein HypB [Thiobacillus denitrificans ATCC 25259]|uniref:Hydrogenase maturation factor HypB n=1 Tax=Thiobacillus denitrificans (strain ATCC 25259 / T1) TaxID=292415 RepID=Q3SJ34_THIDA|nr:hydrogenase nickel incorporation protein HypB [Thiobacillus denitrificans]AAZ97336.1 Hydrogenase accessory protein HypB [Thiobacillus denitrificans ATCC 25259]
MCDTCGCNLTPGNRHLAYKPVARGATAVSVLKGLLAKNDDQAGHNRAHFDRRGILALNLMSSPGSGKTALLEATLTALKGEFTCAVIEGDLETENDAERIRAKGVQAHQIVTGTACHLDAHLVHDALHEMKLDGVDILFIENVGNLVCPASFDLGQHLNVTLLSVTEGDDKPAKYPVMFRAADALLLTKTDLLPVLDDFDLDRAEAHLRNLANPAPVLHLSARKDAGMGPWLDWIRVQLAQQLARVAAGQSRRPAIQPDGARYHHTEA